MTPNDPAHNRRKDLKLNITQETGTARAGAEGKFALRPLNALVID
jgi:hypothetical protein